MALFNLPKVQDILAKYKGLLGTIQSGFSSGSLSDKVFVGGMFGELLTAMVAELVAELDGDENTKGSDKKAAVLEAAGALFDSLAAKLVGLPWWAQLAWPIVAPYVRDFAVNFAGGLVEFVLKKLRGGELAVKLG